MGRAERSEVHAKCMKEQAIFRRQRNRWQPQNLPWLHSHLRKGNQAPRELKGHERKCDDN